MCGIIIVEREVNSMAKKQKSEHEIKIYRGWAVALQDLRGERVLVRGRIKFGSQEMVAITFEQKHWGHEGLHNCVTSGLALPNYSSYWAMETELEEVKK